MAEAQQQGRAMPPPPQPVDVQPVIALLYPLQLLLLKHPNVLRRLSQMWKWDAGHGTAVQIAGAPQCLDDTPRARGTA
jgi:hypothetical protein